MEYVNQYNLLQFSNKENHEAWAHAARAITCMFLTEKYPHLKMMYVTGRTAHNRCFRVLQDFRAIDKKKHSQWVFADDEI